METPKPITGPYRATRLWNEALRIFYNGIPKKRHWRQLRQYDNCFTASEAVSWMHSRLKANIHFGPTVTKEQTQQLLCKFLKAGVFEDVRGIEVKCEQFKENSGLYRLSNRSPFRNPRTPGRANPRTPLASVPSYRTNQVEESGSPVLLRTKISLQPEFSHPPSERSCRKVQVNNLAHQLSSCQLTSRQLEHEEVEDVWKSTVLRRVATVMGFSSLHGVIDTTQIKGEWILWNVTHIGSRGVVQPLEDKDCPPSWVLYGMKSLVNWPSSDQHKLPEYSGSEKDVFKVICDYFTGASAPLTLFSLYGVLVEALIRAETYDAQIAQLNDEAPDDVEEAAASLSSLDSARSLVMKMASPLPCPPKRMAATHHLSLSISRYETPSLPVLRSPVLGGHRMRAALRRPVHQVKLMPQVDLPHNACYETTFTSVEPETRIIPQEEVDFLRRTGRASSRRRRPQFPADGGGADPRRRGFAAAGEKENLVYRSLDRLRSKSGGYVNVAAFGSADRVWGYPQDYTALSGPSSDSDTVGCVVEQPSHSRSVSSLNSTNGTGLSPCSLSDSEHGSHDYENLRHLSHLFQSSNRSKTAPTLGGYAEGFSRVFHSSPSKRLLGRSKGLEFYYGAKACRPGLTTDEGRFRAIESLQLLVLLLPPDQRRKLHLLLRFMTKVAANAQLVLDPEVPLKTLMINTFYRCIVCAADEADYDELTAVRLVTFLMENAEAIMLVPHQLCVQVRDLLAQLQRERIRFDVATDDPVPFTYCRQVSRQNFEQQRHEESTLAVRQLLDHIIDDKTMSLKDKRKRLKQFREAYPEIYFNKFPTAESEASATNLGGGQMQPAKQMAVLARIRSLRL